MSCNYARVQTDGLIAESRLRTSVDHRGILLDEYFFHVIKHWLEVGLMRVLVMQIPNMIQKQIM